jgi:hypothetical protein
MRGLGKPLGRTVLGQIVARLAIIAVVAAVFIGLTAVYASTIRPPANRRGEYREFRDLREFRDRRRRPAGPKLSALPNFLVEGSVVAMIAIAGRMVLRLRL